MKTGAAPPTRKCLDDPQVRKSIGMDKDYALLVNSVQEANEYAVYALTEAGYDGSALQALVAIKPACRTRSWGPGYILLVILYRRVKVPSVRSILYSTT